MAQSSAGQVQPTDTERQRVVDDTTEALKRAIEDVLYDADLSGLADDTSLKDLGANSIDRVDIIIQTMNELSVKCDLMEFKEARSFGEIARVLNARRARDDA